MRRSVTFLSAAGLLAALALLSNAVPSFAAEAHAERHEVPRDLAMAYDAVYDLAFRTGRAAKDPTVRNQRARQRATIAVASVFGDGRTAQPGNTPADEAAGKAAAAALRAGPPGFQNARVLFAYRDAFLAVYDAPHGEQGANPDQVAGIAARAVARAVSQQIASLKSASEDDGTAADGDDDKPNAKYAAAYDAAYKALERVLQADSRAAEYDRCVVAYEAAKGQLIKDHAEWNPSQVEKLAIRALFEVGHDRATKQPHVSR
jgi:hypothetical protein